MNIHELRLVNESAWRESYPHFVRVINEHALEAGVEVGVAFGGHAEAILDGTEVSTLIGIDPYEHQEGYDDQMNLPPAEFECLFWYAIGRLSRFGRRYQHVRGYSAQAAGLFNVEFDFVYLDANHSYEAVAEDLQRWYPRLAPGGVIGGHDYGHAQFPGVKRAVDEFQAATGIAIRIEPATVWWARKPE